MIMETNRVLQTGVRAGEDPVAFKNDLERINSLFNSLHDLSPDQTKELIRLIQRHSDKVTWQLWRHDSLEGQGATLDEAITKAVTWAKQNIPFGEPGAPCSVSDYVSSLTFQLQPAWANGMIVQLNDFGGTVYDKEGNPINHEEASHLTHRAIGIIDGFNPDDKTSDGDLWVPVEFSHNGKTYVAWVVPDELELIASFGNPADYL